MPKINCPICQFELLKVEFPLEKDRVGYACGECEQYAIDKDEDKEIFTIGKRRFYKEEEKEIEFFTKLYLEMYQSLMSKLGKLEEKFDSIDSALSGLPKASSALEIWNRIHEEQTNVTKNLKREE